MGEIFRDIMQVSLGMSVVIALLYIALPVVRKRYDVKWCYFAWLFIGIRLLLPFHIEWYQIPRLSEFVKVEKQHTSVSSSAWEGAMPILITQKQSQKETHERANGTVNVGQGDELQTAEPILTGEQTLATEKVAMKQQEDTLHISQVLKDDTQKFWHIAGSNRVGYIWVIGCASFSIWHMLSYLRFKKDTKRWQIAIDKEEQELFETLKAELGIQREVGLIKTKKVSTPLIMGYLKPTVVLVDHQYDMESLYFILKHELMHYQRKDLWYKLFILIVRAMHWFNPMVHLMAKQVDQELEVGCDISVMQEESSERKRCYMQTILQLAEGKQSPYMSFTTAFKSEKHSLLYRFESIITDKPKKKGILAMLLVGIMCVGCSGYIEESMDIETISSARESGIKKTMDESINYSKNAPSPMREPLSLQEASENAVYQIKYDTGLQFSYNEDLIERFMTSLKNHQEDSIEVIKYIGNKEDILIDEWSTVVTDGYQIYLYSYYQDSKSGKYHYIEEPLVADYIVKKQDDRVTSYRLGDSKETTTKLIELTANYIPEMTILDDTEQEIYREYRKTKNETLLKEISPVTIAKYYVQTELDDDFETQYALMEQGDTDELGRPIMGACTKEEYLERNKSNTNEHKGEILKMFGLIGKGEFIQGENDHNYGYIAFKRYDEEAGEMQDMGFQLFKNDNGIWKVGWLPIQ